MKKLYLFLFALLLTVLPAQASIAIVQHVGTQGVATSNNVPVTVSSTTANLIVVGAAKQSDSDAVVSISDNRSNVYLQVGGASGSSGAMFSDIWFCPNALSGVTTITVTYGVSSATGKKAEVWEVSGFSTAVPDYVVHSSGTGASNVLTGPTVVPVSTAGFIAAIIQASAASIDQNPNSGNEFTSGGDALGTSGGAVSLLSTTAVAHNAQWHHSTSAPTFITSIAAFKEATPSLVSVVQYNSDNSTASSVTLVNSIVATTSNVIVVYGAAKAGTRTITGIADNRSNTYIQASGAQVINGAEMSDMWYCLGATTGVTTITITFSGAAGTFNKLSAVWEVSGFTTPIFDVANGGVNGGTSDNLLHGRAVTTTGTKGFVAAGVLPGTGTIDQVPATGNEFIAIGDNPGGTSVSATAALISTTAALHSPVWHSTALNPTESSTIVAIKESAVTTPKNQFARQY